MNPKQRSNQAGVTLIEVLIAVAVFAVIVTAFYFAINTVMDSVEISRRKTVSTNLANEQMEIFRNMPYADLGVIDGNPAGNIPPSQTKVVDGLEYTINTYISYVDDPYDDVFPDDPLSADYKRARVEVCWVGLNCNNPSVLISDFSSNTVETGEGTGVMKITVEDDDNAGVAGALVKISRTDPAVYIEGYTNTEGELIEPLLDPSYNNYHIEVTKAGYGTDFTSSATAELDPINPDKSIIDGELTEVTFIIDELSDVTVNTIESSTGNPIGDVSFEITGLRKILGTSGDDPPKSVYKYQETHATNAEGVLNMDDIESDFYSFMLNGGSENLYSIAAFSSPEQAPDPVTTMEVTSGTAPTLNIYLDTYTPFNLLFTVRDEFNNLIEAADIRVWDGIDYDETRATTNFGQEFFRELEEKTYNYSVTKAGFAVASGIIEVTGQMQPEITLSPL